MIGVKTRGLRIDEKCDFCGKAAEYVWIMVESDDGKARACDECVCAMYQALVGEWEKTETAR